MTVLPYRRAKDVLPVHSQPGFLVFRRFSEDSCKMREDIFSWHALCEIQLIMRNKPRRKSFQYYYLIFITGGYDDK